MSGSTDSESEEGGLLISEEEVLIRHHDPVTSPSPVASDLEAEVNRDIKRYRAKGLFSITCREFCRSRRRRRLSGKAVVLVFVIEFLERVAYYSALGNILPLFLSVTSLNKSEMALVQSLVDNIVAQLLYPLAGWIADGWVGRYRMVRWCLWVLWVGYAGVAISFAIAYPSNSLANGYNTILLPLLFIVISMGSAGVQVNLIPFGADQILYKTSDELSSYFYWYYWVRNLAGLVYALPFGCFKQNVGVYIITAACIAVGALTLGIILTILLKEWLSDDQERQNPPKMIAAVLLNATSAKRPQERSAFSFTGFARQPQRLDLAKIPHGGKFSEETVEDVKTFGRVMLLLLSVGGVLTLYTGIANVIALQFNHMENSYLQNKILYCTPSDLSVWVINVVVILLTIPFLDQCLYPFLRHYVPNMLKRIGIGYILLLVSAMLLILYEGIGHHVNLPKTLSSNETLCMFDETSETKEHIEMSSWLVLLPFVFVSVAEVFVMVTALEFVYAQSPHSMRGMMVGLFFWIKGIFSTLSSLILFLFSNPCWIQNLSVQTSTQSCGFWYYLIFFVLGLMALVLYVAVSRWYQNRTRGDLEHDPYYRLRLDGSTQLNR